MIWQAFLSVALAIAITEVIKFQLGGRRKLFQPGGMPSTHSALAASVSTAVYFESGLSVVFFATTMFALSIAYDSMGFRWEIVRHSRALNKLTKSKKFIPVGHTQKEVIVGLLLGVLITVVVYMV